MSILWGTLQNYLAGSKLNIDINTSELKCEVFIPDPKIAYLREKDTENNLSKDLVYGLYRYQNNSNIDNNYICLGNDCSIESNDMYRIIGINEEGEIKVIKNTPYADLAWDDDAYNDYIWGSNALSENLNSEFLSYLPNELQYKIKETLWKVGGIGGDGISSQIFNEEESLKYDEYLENEEAEKADQLYTNAFLRTENNFADEFPSKISLMSITDYCSSFPNDENSSCFSSSIENWLSPKEWEQEWTMLYSGYWKYYCEAHILDSGGPFGAGNVIDELPVRPTFFLTSEVKLEGAGTIDSPFTIGIEGTYSGPKYQSN